MDGIADDHAMPSVAPKPKAWAYALPGGRVGTERFDPLAPVPTRIGSGNWA